MEVEISNHSLQKHVVPQVRALRDGDYGDDACAVIAGATGISADEAATLIRYVPRYVAVVSNHEDAAWYSALADENIQFLSVAGYYQQGGQLAHLVTGLLHPAERSIGFGTVLSSHQSVRFPTSEFWQPGSYRIADADGVANWNCFVDGQSVWLAKRRGIINLPDKAWVQIIAQDDGLLLLRQIG